jgi:hypothetical protein
MIYGDNIAKTRVKRQRSADKTMTREKLKVFVRAFFAVCSIAIYCVFLIFDGIGLHASSVNLKYSGIIACFLFACAFSALGGGKNALIPVALALTLAADLFLLVLGKYYEVGVAVFIIAQSAYFAHLCVMRGKAKLSIILRLSVMVALEVIIALAGIFSILNALCAAYFTMIFFNLIDSALCINKESRAVLLTVGFALFILCDVCVGLNNLLPPFSALASLVSYGMWLFYFPSQTLIAMTASVNGNKN